MTCFWILLRSTKCGMVGAFVGSWCVFGSGDYKTNWMVDEHRHITQTEHIFDNKNEPLCVERHPRWGFSSLLWLQLVGECGVG